MPFAKSSKKITKISKTRLFKGYTPFKEDDHDLVPANRSSEPELSAGRETGSRYYACQQVAEKLFFMMWEETAT